MTNDTMRLYLLLFCLIFGLNLNAQGTVQAENLLKQLSTQIKSQENIRLNFSYVLENKKEKIKQESEGNVTLQKERYKLNFLEGILLFDGEKLYTIVPENEEITISLPEDEEDIAFNPQELLNFYEKGYAYEWDISQRVMGKNIQFIKLHPAEENEDLNYLLLGIDTDKMQMYRLIEIGKNGTTTTLTIKSQENNITLPKDYFEFNAKAYPNYYINQ